MSQRSKCTRQIKSADQSIVASHDCIPDAHTGGICDRINTAASPFSKVIVNRGIVDGHVAGVMNRSPFFAGFVAGEGYVRNFDGIFIQ